MVYGCLWHGFTQKKLYKSCYDLAQTPRLKLTQELVDGALNEQGARVPCSQHMIYLRGASNCC